MESVIKMNQGDTKWDIRHKVWNYIEVKNLASFPRPVHNRIPNFKGALKACGKVPLLDIFTKAAVVKVAPDKPLEGVRLASLQARKTLLVPTPRLKTGLFNRIATPKGATKKELHVCSTSQGVKEMSVPVGLDDKVQVDLVVVGSVAVSSKGYRIGKGEGFADLEYAMMACMGAVCESTVVVTIVHDCQLHTEILKKIPILKKLRTLEQEAGKDVALKTTLDEEDQTKKSKELKWQPNCHPNAEL
ncbi:methenyltetrahydrofolate synthase domain-containing protein isoform X2 [Carassius carassius]|uniref:methenyltetrahydrofolate synthase domain-containing protein isoform X2 n=1 Tax=Carassius carassius TaxID=217509 RepID=UPI00286941BE|nr:methenyltetrahydrofolate synthase domain-containing protein isoform X2 [Carassius carassius]